MSGVRDGGEAFPSQGDPRYPKDSITGSAKPGMSLRDYFAAKAMAAVWSKLDPDSVRDVSISQTAKAAYQLADAMLTARTER